MSVHTFAPRAAAPLLQRIAIVAAGVESTRAVLPEAGIVVGLRYRGETVTLEAGGARSYPNSALTGVLPSARTVRTSADGQLILGLLRPAAAARLVRAPVDTLFGVTCALDDIVPAALAQRTVHALYRATSDTERVGVFEQFMLEAAAPRAPDPVVERALAEIDRSAGNIRIAALQVGRSQDALERRFRAVVGATPKQYASLVRFRKALTLHQRGRLLTRIAIEAGYSDQSHFNREIRRFTGFAPSALFGIPGGYC